MSQTVSAEKGEGVCFSFWLEGDERADYRIAAFKAEEGLFSLTRIEVLLKISASSFSFADRLGKKATVAIRAEGLAKPVFLSGAVAEASEFFEAGEVLTRLVLLPSLAALEKELRYRVFQELTVPDIVETLLCEHGITDALWQLEGSFTPRHFCMQYGETDLAFMHRILAEEGIFYYFLHGEKGAQHPVLCNNIALLPDCPNGGLKHDSHDSHGLYDIAGAAEIYCHSLRRTRSAMSAQAPAGRRQKGKAAGDLAGRGAAVLFSPPGGQADGSALRGIAHLPLPLCGHKAALSCPFDKSLNGAWALIAVRHEGISAESSLLSHDLADYFDENLHNAARGFAEMAASSEDYGRAFGSASLLPRLMAANGGAAHDSRFAASPYGAPYKNAAAHNVVSMAGKNFSGRNAGVSGAAARKAVYACAFTALDSEAVYCPPASLRPVIAGPQEARLIRVDKAARRYKLALRIYEGGAAADEVRFWAYADTRLGAAIGEIAAAAAARGGGDADIAAKTEKFLLEFLGGNPDRPIALAHSILSGGAQSAAARQSRPAHGGLGQGEADCAPGAAGSNAAADEALFEEQVKNTFSSLPWEESGAPPSLRPPFAYQQLSGKNYHSGSSAPRAAIPLAQIQADLHNSAAANAANRPKAECAAAAKHESGSRFLRISEHRREDVDGVYELNCGEKYLCRSKNLHLSASDKLILRGPGGKIVIDRYSVTLEAPLIRLRGRLAAEEDMFDRQESVKIAIRDELPLVADCGAALPRAEGGAETEQTKR